MRQTINAIRYDIGEACIRLDTTPSQVFLSEEAARKWFAANGVTGAKWEGYLTLNLPAPRA